MKNRFTRVNNNLGFTHLESSSFYSNLSCLILKPSCLYYTILLFSIPLIYHLESIFITTLHIYQKIHKIFLFQELIGGLENQINSMRHTTIRHLSSNSLLSGWLLKLAQNLPYYLPLKVD